MVSAFSVPKAKRQQKLSSNPGPGQYNPENSPKIVKATDPQYSFGKEGRKDSVSAVPGPGSYEQKANFIKESNPRYSLSPRREEALPKLNVGPGQYNPSDRYAKQKSPSYSLYGRSNSEMKGIKLGPGEYDIKGELELKKSGFAFSKEARDRSEKHGIPGPGTYDYTDALFKYGSKEDPSYGFGARLNHTEGPQVPGPGSYESRLRFSRIGGIISRQLRNSYTDNKTPGPGNYNPDNSKVKDRDPLWSLSKSPREPMSQSSVLGPGAYDHDKNYKTLATKNRGYNFGHEDKLRYDLNNVPGPGAYDGKPMRSRQSVKIAGRLQDPAGLKVPGPGSYDNQKYDYDSWLKGSGKYSLAKSARDKSENGNVPGPGAYYSKQLNTAGKISFPKDPKLKHQKNSNPGPGNYDLKPFFADVPHYLLPNKKTT